MNKLNKNIVFGITLLGAYVASTVFSQPMLAQYYGQDEGNPKILVDKFVRPITDTKFYENIGVDQNLFNEGDTIEFKIKVENVGNNTLNNIKLTDDLPKYLNLYFYPGVYNKTANIIETQIDKLEPGEVKEYLIRAKIVDLPISKYECSKPQFNVARAVAGDISDSDKVNYYVGCRNVPTTGSNDILIKTIIAAGLGLITIRIRKLSRGY